MCADISMQFILIHSIASKYFIMCSNFLGRARTPENVLRIHARWALLDALNVIPICIKSKGVINITEYLFLYQRFKLSSSLNS
jgi:hypothetical protein